MLRFATCQYIDEGRLIILKGASGNGKTFISCALGNAACRKFKSVRYIRMPELLDELSIAKANGEFAKVIKAYQKVDFLILDEWLIRKLTPNEAFPYLTYTVFTGIELAYPEIPKFVPPEPFTKLVIVSELVILTTVKSP